ncbi:hypothetical protein C8R32_10923 [Nitrosospira sp. Nsp5]|uniref:Uncharacterized protein n=1 Tax=Nitrosospira multiformis TaxID=1231 RepID=A0ABY0TN50_9PROT|nr:MULTISPECIES: hypothetical protein [Nitrosospira]PTR06739.1 hypothetical protein C8R32_10923 [Nitrosospira sp. Nsp5]SDQ87005.1 hypothetical protein SAMN05216402_2620 [Nitrosospira multiformis]
MPISYYQCIHVGSIEGYYTASPGAMSADLVAWAETVQDQRPLPELANIGQQLFVVPVLVLRHNDFL